MIHPIPSGTRDVLPDEMRELRAIADAVREECLRHGYGEVSTPALEYESTLLRGDARAAEPAYRLFDELGNVLVLRSDMTIPIARVVATRYPNTEPPLRFCYVAPAYRAVKVGRGAQREFLQAGIELVGSPKPDGTAEALTVLCAALDATGLRSYRVGLGSASLYPALLSAFGVSVDAAARVAEKLVQRDLVGLAEEVAALSLGEEATELLVRVPQLRGGVDVLDLPSGPAEGVTERLKRVFELVPDSVRERLIFDLGLTRGLGYYTGAVFEVYDPALGEALGGGGRYDDLLGRFGRPLPAVGWALGLERLHTALVGEGRFASAATGTVIS